MASESRLYHQPLVGIAISIYTDIHTSLQLAAIAKIHFAVTNVTHGEIIHGADVESASKRFSFTQTFRLAAFSAYQLEMSQLFPVRTSKPQSFFSTALSLHMLFCHTLNQIATECIKGIKIVNQVLIVDVGVLLAAPTGSVFWEGCPEANEALWLYLFHNYLVGGILAVELMRLVDNDKGAGCLQCFHRLMDTIVAITESAT